MTHLTCSSARRLLLAATVTLVLNASLAEAASETDEWRSGGHNWRQNYYSPLTDIDATNVDKLGFAWQYDIDFNSMLEATPIVIDGVMYTSGSGGIVYALDAVTGRQLWKFEPTMDKRFNAEVGYGPTNRGVAVSGGKVYVGAVDGWLYALNAANGSVVWKVDTITDRTRDYGNKGRIVAFKLGGGDVPHRPLVSRAAPSTEPPVPDTGTPEQIASGKALFAQHCAMCHANGRAPDLTRMTAATHTEFPNIVLKGARSAKGMPSFAEVISETEAQAIHVFVINAAASAAKQSSSAPTANVKTVEGNR